MPGQTQVTQKLALVGRGWSEEAKQNDLQREQGREKRNAKGGKRREKEDREGTRKVVRPRRSPGRAGLWQGNLF